MSDEYRCNHDPACRWGGHSVRCLDDNSPRVGGPVKPTNAELESALAPERAARTAAEATIAQVREWNIRPAGGHYVAELMHILAASPSAALDAHDAQVAAEAWDEGYDAGSGGEYHSLGSNPYRKAAQ